MPDDFIGERGGTRTLDPMIKSHVLYYSNRRLSQRSSSNFSKISQRLCLKDETRFASPALIRTSNSARPVRVRKVVRFLDRIGHGCRTELTSAFVKVCGCRPVMTVPRTPGPAYANLQWRKPREVWRSCASDAMGISALAVCCLRALDASFGRGGRGGEIGRPS